MSRFQRLARAASALSVIAALCLGAPIAQAHEVTVGDLEIGHPWSRATAPTAPTGAVYFHIENHGGMADRLLSAAGDVADAVEIHQNSMDSSGTMQMRPVDGVDIPAGGEAVLEPGGLHVMLIGLHAPLKAGASFPLTLTFEHAGTVTVDVEIQSAGSAGPSHED
jgi:copper(I)-binding protein